VSTSVQNVSAKKVDEKDEVVDTASECCYSVTIYDRHVVSENYGFVIMLHGTGAT